jgi:hypothetical protein
LWLIPSCFIVATQTVEENCTPLSDVRYVGSPNLAIHPLMSAVEQSPAVMFLSGIASAQHVERSITVKMYWALSGAGDRGPKMSTWMWVNLQVGTGMGVTRAAGWRVTFAVWHCMQSLHH